MKFRFNGSRSLGTALLLGSAGILCAHNALGAEATPAEVNLCKSICESRDNVSCKESPKEGICVNNCKVAASESDPCRKEFDAWLDYDAKVTWACDSQGYPHDSGSAPGVSAAFFQCWSNTAGGGEKPVQKPAICGVSTNDYYCDNCLSFNCAAQSAACGASTRIARL